jgi:hypothetical protein
VSEYPKAFRARGLDVLGGDPTAVAEAVATSPVHPELVAALDDWAALPLDEPTRSRVLAVLRRADPGPWLDRFRDPAVRADQMRLWWLARSADPAALRPATLAALAEVMGASGLDPGLLLLRALYAHPNDFHIPFQLGLRCTWRKEYDTAIVFYRMARVTRPYHLAVLINLSYALLIVGDVKGTFAAFEELRRIDRTRIDRKYIPALYDIEKEYRRLGVRLGLPPGLHLFLQR